MYIDLRAKLAKEKDILIGKKEESSGQLYLEPIDKNNYKLTNKNSSIDTTEYTFNKLSGEQDNDYIFVNTPKGIPGNKDFEKTMSINIITGACLVSHDSIILHYADGKKSPLKIPECQGDKRVVGIDMINNLTQNDLIEFCSRWTTINNLIKNNLCHKEKITIYFNAPVNYYKLCLRKAFENNNISEKLYKNYIEGLDFYQNELLEREREMAKKLGINLEICYALPSINNDVLLNKEISTQSIINDCIMYYQKELKKKGLTKQVKNYNINNLMLLSNTFHYENIILDSEQTYSINIGIENFRDRNCIYDKIHKDIKLQKRFFPIFHFGTVSYEKNKILIKNQRDYPISIGKNLQNLYNILSIYVPKKIISVIKKYFLKVNEVKSYFEEYYSEPTSPHVATQLSLSKLEHNTKNDINNIKCQQNKSLQQRIISVKTGLELSI